jgi:hypothetical protein
MIELFPIGHDARVVRASLDNRALQDHPTIEIHALTACEMYNRVSTHRGAYRS